MTEKEVVWSYTETVHKKTYKDIAPTSDDLSTAGKVVLITGATGGIGSATALSFAESQPKALILLGRNSASLGKTKNLIGSHHPSLVVEIHEVDLCDSRKVHKVFGLVAKTFGGIDILVHAAGVLAPVVPFNEADTFTFFDGFKTTIVGTLAVAQAFVEFNPKPEVVPKGDEDPAKNKPTVEKTITFINLTTAGIFAPPRTGMAAYVSSKMAAVKLLECFVAENEHVRLHNVHPGYYETAMSQQLEKSMKPEWEKDDISLVSDFLVWIASSEAKFLDGKLVFAAWDVNELKKRQKEIVGQGPGTGELYLKFQGFPRYRDGNALFRA
ncbi:short chain dehydrogenase reductase [Trichoderma compactum]